MSADLAVVEEDLPVVEKDLLQRNVVATEVEDLPQPSILKDLEVKTALLKRTLKGSKEARAAINSSSPSSSSFSSFNAKMPSKQSLLKKTIRNAKLHTISESDEEEEEKEGPSSTFNKNLSGKGSLLKSTLENSRKQAFFSSADSPDQSLAKDLSESHDRMQPSTENHVVANFEQQQQDEKELLNLVNELVEKAPSSSASFANFDDFVLEQDQVAPQIAITSEDPHQQQQFDDFANFAEIDSSPVPSVNDFPASFPPAPPVSPFFVKGDLPDGPAIDSKRTLEKLDSFKKILDDLEEEPLGDAGFHSSRLDEEDDGDDPEVEVEERRTDGNNLDGSSSMNPSAPYEEMEFEHQDLIDAEKQKWWWSFLCL